jgi:hypothetical protein
VEIQTLIYIALFVFWILSRITSAKKTQEEVGPPPPPRRETVIQQARQIAQDLGHLEADIEAARPQLDPEVLAQTEFVFERYLRKEAQRLHGVIEETLETEDEWAVDNIAAELGDARALLSFFDRLLQAGRSHTRLRRREEFAPPRRVADRLVEQFYEPFKRFADAERLELAMGPPLPVVQAAPIDRTARDAIATIYVPPSVNFDLLHWSLVGEEVGIYLALALPDIHEEIHESLELQTSPGPAGYDTESLARLLFASWSRQTVNDAIGALLLGPSYLRALAVLYANSETSSQVTTVYYTQEGFDPSTPAHVRVHLAARWLERMGYSGEAGEVRRAWDRKHESPEVLYLPNANLPLAPLLASMGLLVDRLFDLELHALGGRRLSQLPGLSNWNEHQRDAADGQKSLLAGNPARGSARALVAAAIDAALENRERTETIRESLYQSIHSQPARRRPARVKEAVPPIRAAKSSTRPSARDFAEALILGEILLEPRGK